VCTHDIFACVCVCLCVCTHNIFVCVCVCVCVYVCVYVLSTYLRSSALRASPTRRSTTAPPPLLLSSPRFVSHVTNMNESCHTHLHMCPSIPSCMVRSHVTHVGRLAHIGSWVMSHMKECWHTYGAILHMCSLRFVGHVTHEGIPAHVGSWVVSHMKECWHTYGAIIVICWSSFVGHVFSDVRGSCHTCRNAGTRMEQSLMCVSRGSWVMSSTRFVGHVTHERMLAHTWSNPWYVFPEVRES